MLTGAFNAAEIFSVHLPRSVCHYHPVSTVYRQILGSVCALAYSVNYGTLYSVDGFVPFQIMPNQLRFAQVDSNQIGDTSNR